MRPLHNCFQSEVWKFFRRIFYRSLKPSRRELVEKEGGNSPKKTKSYDGNELCSGFNMWWKLLPYFALPGSLCALYNGNPSLPQMPETGLFISKDCWLGMRAGYEIDWSYDVNLHLDSPELSHKQTHGYKALTQLGVITLDFMNRLDLFVNLGSFDCKWFYDLGGFGDLSFETNTSFIWGVGGRALLAYWGDLQLSVMASYRDTKNPLEHLDVDGVSYSTQGSHVHWNAWQLGGGIAYKFGWFYPYVGVDYLDTTLEADSLKSVAQFLPSDHLRFIEEDHFGIFLGIGVGPRKGFNLNIEARFINENALTGSIDIRF